MWTFRPIISDILCRKFQTELFEILLFCSLKLLQLLQLLAAVQSGRSPVGECRFRTRRHATTLCWTSDEDVDSTARTLGLGGWGWTSRPHSRIGDDRADTITARIVTHQLRITDQMLAHHLKNENNFIMQIHIRAPTALNPRFPYVLLSFPAAATAPASQSHAWLTQ